MANETAVLDDVMEIETPREQSAPAILSGLPEGRNSDLPEWFRARQARPGPRFTSSQCRRAKTRRGVSRT
jgi:hypothetical protein